MAKPGGAVVLDTGNALIRSPRSWLAFQEGAGGWTRDLVTGRAVMCARPFSLDFPPWRTNADGTAGQVGFAGSGGGAVNWHLGNEGEDVALPTGDCTIVYSRRRFSTTTAQGLAFGFFLQTYTGVDYAAPFALQALIPGPDGTVYWDYGGRFAPNRVSWSGYTPPGTMEHWILVGGSTGSRIYFNSSVPKATTGTTPSSRSAWTEVFHLGERDYFSTEAEVTQFGILGTAWSDADVATFLANPYAMLTAGTPTKASFRSAALPAVQVSAYPTEADFPNAVKTVTANSAADLTAKLATLVTGDTLEIPPGTYVGNFRLPAVNTRTAGWVRIRSTQHALLPLPGARITPADAVHMPTLVSPGTGPCLWARSDASGVVFEGIEMTWSGAVDGTGAGWTYALLLGVNATFMDANGGRIDGWYDPSGTGPNAPGARVIIDRCYSHLPADAIAAGQGNITRGVQIEHRDVRVCGSIITDAQHAGQDAQAILIASQGPGLIENNDLAATGQSIMSGGQGYGSGVGDGFISIYGDAFIPKDWTIRRNTMRKLTRWQGTPTGGGAATLGLNPAYIAPARPPAGWWTVKPLYEIKMGIRFLIEANTMLNGYSWPAFTIDCWNQIDHAGYPETTNETMAKITDITIRYNVCPRQTVTGEGNLSLVQLYDANRPIRRVHVHDNLAWVYTDAQLYGSQGIGHQRGNAFYFSTQTMAEANEDVLIEHNTIFSTWAAGMFGSSQPGHYERVRLRNNIVGYGGTGLAHEVVSFVPAGGAAMDLYLGDRQFVKHAMVDFGDSRGVRGGSFDPGYTQAAWDAMVPATGQFIIPGVPAAAGISATDGTLVPAGVLDAIDAVDSLGVHRKMGVDFVALAAALAGDPGSPPPALRRAKGFRASSIR